MSSEDIQIRIQTLVEKLLPNGIAFVPEIAASASIAVLLFILYLGQLRRRHHLEKENSRLKEVATRAKEILATVPDGLFLWDHILGGIACSRQLATLLSLANGTAARYDDIRSCFEGDSLKLLEQNVSLLRANGTPFSILLTYGKKVLEATGARAETKAAQPVADIVWVRDISNITLDIQRLQIKDPETLSTKNTSGLDDRHLTALLDAMPIPIWLRDSSLKIAFSNRAAQSIVNPDPRMAEEARISGEAFTERQLLDLNGAARLMDITEISLGVSSDNPRKNRGVGGSVGFAIDRIGQADQAQEKDRVLHTLDIAIAIFDKTKRLNFFNEAFVEIFGLDSEWLAKNPIFSELLDRLREARNLPEVPDFQAFKADLETYFNNLSSTHTELIHLPDGRALKQMVSPNLNGGLIFAFSDITQQLGLERSVKEASAVQRETLDNLHEGVAVFGSDGRLKLFNPMYERIWDLDLKKLGEEPHISQILDQTRPMIPPPSGQRGWEDNEWDVHRNLIITQTLSRENTSGKMFLINGSVINHSNIPLPDGAMLLSFLDITDSAKVETALRERAEAFQEADRLKTEFIAKVSYELRTPLNSVIGFADMLSQNLFGELNPRQSEYARGILDTSQSLVSILGDILDLASIEAGRMELEQSTFDIHAFLVSSLNLIQERIRQKKQKFHFDCPPDIGWMIGDEKRLKQVLFNLLSNAISFTPPHGEIKLIARRLDSELEFSVHDSGVGFPSDGRERLFRPFEKDETKRPAENPGIETSGKGLGLSIVRNFIELHGGTVDLKSQPGRGSTVICRVPSENPGRFNKKAL